MTHLTNPPPADGAPAPSTTVLDDTTPIPTTQVPGLLDAVYGRLGALLGEEGEADWRVLLLGEVPARQVVAAAGYLVRWWLGLDEVLLSVGAPQIKRVQFRSWDASTPYDDLPDWSITDADVDTPEAVTVTVTPITLADLDYLTDQHPYGLGVPMGQMTRALQRWPRRGGTVRTLLRHSARIGLPGVLCPECGQPTPCPSALAAAEKLGVELRGQPGLPGRCSRCGLGRPVPGNDHRPDWCALCVRQTTCSHQWRPWRPGISVETHRPLRTRYCPQCGVHELAAADAPVPSTCDHVWSYGMWSDHATTTGTRRRGTVCFFCRLEFWWEQPAADIAHDPTTRDIELDLALQQEPLLDAYLARTGSTTE